MWRPEGMRQNAQTNRVAVGLQRCAEAEITEGQLIELVELRNAAGTGHGKGEPSPSGLADDARLAADATAAWIRSVLGAYSELTNGRS